MRVLNVHERRIPAPVSRVGPLLAELGGPHDRLWPGDRWPPMRREGPLAPGTRARHGPVRYRVEVWEPGRRLRFRFSRPRGFRGTHEFSVQESEGGTLLRHELAMRARGWALLSWPLFFRPLHDAVIEDAFDRAAVALGLAPERRRWSLWVRALRRVLRPRTAGRAGPTITTSRLSLRPLSSADGEVLHAHWNEPDVGRFLWDGQEVPRDQVHEVVRKSRRLFRKQGVGLWGIRLHGDSRLIGCAGFWHFHDPPELELLVSLSPPWWGRGLAREALEALIRFAFEELDWDYVQGSADEPNEASRRLLERLGLEPRGERPGVFGPIVVYRLEREGWT